MKTDWYIILFFFLFFQPVWSQNENITVVVPSGHKVKNFIISPDEKYLGTSDGKSIGLWDLNTFRMIQLLNLSHDDIDYGPYSSNVIYVKKDFTIKDKENLYEGYDMLLLKPVDIRKSKELLPKKKTSSKLDFKLDKKNSILNVYDKQSGILLTQIGKEKLAPLHCVDITNGDSLILATGLHPQIWDIHEGKLKGKIPYLNWLKKDTSLIFRDDYTIPLLKRHKEHDYWHGWGYYGRIYTRGHFTPSKDIVLCGYGNNISKWSLEGGIHNVIKTETGPVFDYFENDGELFAATFYGLNKGKVCDSCLFLEKRYLRNEDMYPFMLSIAPPFIGNDNFFAAELNYIIGGNTKYPSLFERMKYIGTTVINLNMSEKRNRLLASCELGHLVELYIKNGMHFFRYNTRIPFRLSRVSCSTFIGDSLVSAGCSDGVVSVWKSHQTSPIWYANAHRGEIIGIKAMNNRPILLTAATDGWMKMWDIQAKKEKMAFFSPNESNDYLILAPDHYYKGTKGINEYINFSKGMETFNFDQFDLQLNRPDIIVSRLGGRKDLVDILHKAWLKRIKRMGYTPEQLSPEIHVPKAEFLNKKDIPLITTDQSVELKYCLSDNKYRISNIYLYQNGVPIYGRDGLNISSLNKKKIEKSICIDLAEGDNVITLNCMNEKGAESYRQQIIIRCNKPTVEKDLWIISVGVSKYQQNRYNLNFADKDANDFSHLIQETLGDRYEKVHCLLLTNEEATVSSISNIPTWLKNSKRDDTVVCYFAGHGLLDNQLDYYLSTHETNFQNPRKGSIRYDSLEIWIDRSKALNRCVFIDACHSGQIDKDDYLGGSKTNIPEGEIAFRSINPTQYTMRYDSKQVNELLNELFFDIKWGIGATIMASSGGMEVSVESSRWQNGLFTWCIKKGIIDNSGDLNGDGVITMNELTTFLSKEVMQLSRGKQTPALRMGKSHMNNFIIKKYR